ncbi:MAG: hypothetical protein A2V66_00730 [Ignavibacteria bacterium RBG_13_36_8]|nr:MAG: hypothetical protein A2V66_00730 [Ignavibacteria bacterium RBG_13_36_8]
MNFKKTILEKPFVAASLLFVVGFVVLFTACSTSETVQKESKYYVGTITVVGNEPFTELALQISGDETYLLVCDKELSSRLFGEQGKIYKIEYKETVKKERGTALVVLKAEHIPKSD